MAHSLFGEHVRIMHETTVLAQLCKPRATWSEVDLYSVLDMCDVFVFGCVWLCLVVLVCVVGCLSVGVDALAVVWW